MKLSLLSAMATVLPIGTGALRFDELLMAFSMSMRGTGVFCHHDLILQLLLKDLVLL